MRRVFYLGRFPLYTEPMFTAAIVLGLTLSMQQDVKPDEFHRQITKTVSAKYLVSVPEGYDADKTKKWPLILFLHGAGERGDDVEKVKVHGPMKEIQNGRKIPAVVIAPQCPEGQWWNMETLTALLDTAETKYRIDTDREYLTGLSMGGFGTWELAGLQPTRFAAIAPVCGGGNALLARRLMDIPMWVVHGDADPVVPVKESQSMVEAVEKAGGHPKFTVVKDGGHDVWTAFYADDAFYMWLFAQSKAK
jgi:predicted peptidase